MNRSDLRPADELTVQFGRIQRNALLAGLIGVVLCIVGAFLNLGQFYQSYLFAYLFWLGIGLGCFAWVMVYHLTGGRWGLVTRRLFEICALMTLLMALLFIPLFFGLSQLYIWARPDAVAADALLQHKQPYLNIPFFTIRAVMYFVVWIGIALLLNKWSRDQDSAEAPPSVLTRVAYRLRQFSGPGLAAYGLTMTFAAIDWLMSLEPKWFSTVFGALVASGQALTALAFVIVVLALLADYAPFASVMTPNLFSDLGKLLLTAVLLWSYLAFVQFLIIWSGNIPEEVEWFLHRLEGGWSWVAIFMVIFEFAAPFAALLSGRVKRRARTLALVAGSVMAANLVYLFWVVAPVFHASVFHLHWLDFVTPVAIGGVWIAVFVWQLRNRPLLPAYGLTVQEVDEHE